LLLVVDSNVYIFGFGLVKVPACKDFIYEAIAKKQSVTVRIPRTIVEEVRLHLAPEDFSTFIRVVNTLTAIDEDFLIPFELGSKYESRGFKPADAFIAAYAEWVGADALVTENRHFLSKHPNMPFKILTAEKCLKFI